MNLSFEGIVIAIGEVQKGTTKTGTEWCSLDFVVEESGNPEHPQSMVFKIWGQEKIKEFNIQKDEYVKVHFNSQYREYNGKFFSQQQAWRIERDNTSYNPNQNYAAPQQQPVNQAPQPQQQPVSQAPRQQVTQEDDLPF